MRCTLHKHPETLEEIFQEGCSAQGCQSIWLCNFCGDNPKPSQFDHAEIRLQEGLGDMDPIHNDLLTSNDLVSTAGSAQPDIDDCLGMLPDVAECTNEHGTMERNSLTSVRGPPKYQQPTTAQLLTSQTRYLSRVTQHLSSPGQRRPRATNCARCCSKAKRAGALAIVVLTLGMLVMNLWAFDGRGLVKPCPERKDHIGWSTALHGFLGMSFSAIVAAWLLANAETPYLRQVARYTVSVWLSAWAGTLAALVCVDSEATVVIFVRAVRSLLGEGTWLVSLVYFCVLVIGRMKALESSIFCGLGTRRLWQLLMVCGVCCAPVAIILTLATAGVLDGQLWRVFVGCFLLLSTVFFLAFCICALYYMNLARLIILQATESDYDSLAAEARRSARTLAVQMAGLGIGQITTVLRVVSRVLSYSSIWPTLELDWESAPFAVVAALRAWPPLLDMVGNALAALAFSGGLAGAVRAGAAASAAEQRRSQRWADFSSSWLAAWSAPGRGPSELAWLDKVCELAGRGFTLEALLRFYRSLGSEIMAHFDASRHTTADVVWQAIIPLSSASRSALAATMMEGQYTRPRKIVTHSWSTLFCDLVAAIVADAIGDSEYAMISHLLHHDVDLLEEWVTRSGSHQLTYWVCAFSINQHLGICGSPDSSPDPVTGDVRPACRCGLDKAWNHTEPTLSDGRSIPCELNKFDDMMKFLSATDPDFQQVVAVDSDFNLFSRAWCVAEIATADSAGMLQRLKLKSSETLVRSSDKLRSLKIQDMRASRPEDKEQIMASIQDVDSFNGHLQQLLFRDLFPAWNNLDALEKMTHVGRTVRWQTVMGTRRSVGLWHARTL